MITLSIQTVRLEEAIANLGYLQKQGITDLLEIVMRDTFSAIKAEARRIVRTGEGMAPNTGRYAVMKANGMIYKQSYGTYWPINMEYADQPLGILTGELYEGIGFAQEGILIKTPEGVAMTVEFNEPSHISYVHEGKARVAARPFFIPATVNVEAELEKDIEELLEKWNITSPPPAFISKIVSEKLLDEFTSGPDAVFR